MKPLTLQLKRSPPCRVDASPLTPRALAGKSRAEIAHLTLIGWNETFRVGDLFAVRGDDASRIVLQDLDGSFLRVGAHLADGDLTVAGRAGDYLGESMTGGALNVRGDAGDFAGAGMKGGIVTCAGNVGAFAGAGRSGEMKGMSGGTIVIRGNAGDRVGDRMRRGLLLIEGTVGDYCAARMLAGTLVALGGVGANPGYLMRRGTVLLARSVELLPTFNHSGDYELLAIRLLQQSLVQYGAAFKSFAHSARRFSRWLGDLAAAGQGEILVARDAS
jgi:formylmethanofuran dehydrogenase subunit C